MKCVDVVPFCLNKFSSRCQFRRLEKENLKLLRFCFQSAAFF